MDKWRFKNLPRYKSNELTYTTKEIKGAVKSGGKVIVSGLKSFSGKTKKRITKKVLSKGNGLSTKKSGGKLGWWI